MNAALGQLSAGTELAYIGLLVLSGLIMLIVGALGFGLKSMGQRVLNIVIGLAFIGYGGYLLIAAPETVYVLWYVFVVPVLLLINVFKAVRAKSS